MSIIDKIRSADDLNSELYEIPKWDVTILIRSMSARERATYASFAAADGASPEEMAQSAMQRVELIARIFAETGVKDLFRNIYALVQRYENREKMFYLNGKFIPIDVSRWKEKLNCTVNVGIGSGSQQTKMQTMSSIMQILGTLVQQGGMGTLVTPQNLYNAISEYISQAG